LKAAAVAVGGFWGWKPLLFLLLIAMLVWYIRPYFTYFSDLVKSTNDLLNATTAPETKKEEAKKKLKKIKGSPEPDDSTSNVQGGAQGGYCLAGEWKNVRSCVKIPKGTECVSGQLFPSEVKCINPGLRD
jgi:hypothetical protein